MSSRSARPSTAIVVVASLILAIFFGLTIAKAANPNFADFTHGGCSWRAQAGFDTGYPEGDASTSDLGNMCSGALMHATGHFYGDDSQYHTLYSGWRDTRYYANAIVFYWAHTTWVWDDSQVQYPTGYYSSIVSVLAN